MKPILLVGIFAGSCLLSTTAVAQDETSPARLFKPTIEIVSGKPVSFASCPGVCSASPVFETNVYLSSAAPWFIKPDTSFELRPMLGFGGAVYSAKINGVNVDVDSEAIKFGAELRYKEMPDLAVVMHFDLLGMVRTTGGNLPRQVDISGDADIGLQYDLTPNTHITLGYALRSIPQSLNSVGANGVSLGIGWSFGRK